MCKREQVAKWRKESEEYAESRKHHTRTWKFKKYGITPAQFDACVAATGGGCQICTHVPGNALSVDFYEGVVRGLLCRGCLRQVRRWSGRDIEVIAATTSDPLITRYLNYLRDPPGLLE